MSNSSSEMFRWWKALETTRTASTACRCDKRTDLSAACLKSRYHPSYTNLEGKPCGLGHVLRWCSVIAPFLWLSVALIIYITVILTSCEGSITWQWFCRSKATRSHLFHWHIKQSWAGLRKLFAGMNAVSVTVTSRLIYTALTNEEQLQQTFVGFTSTSVLTLLVSVTIGQH